MSLELAIQANTAAIQQLIAVMSSGKFMSADGLKDVMTVGHVSGEVGADEKKAARDRIEQLNAEKLQAMKAHLLEMQAASQAASQTASQPAEEPKAAEPEVLETAKALAYEADVLPVLHKFLVAKGKPAAETLLKKYAVDKFSKVPVEQLGDLLADINKEMGVA